MKRFYKNYCEANLWFHVLTVISVLLIITSFILPPAGAVDPSVLAAIGEIFAFAALWTVVKAIDKGLDAKVTHGSTSVTVGDLNDAPGPDNLDNHKLEYDEKDID